MVSFIKLFYLLMSTTCKNATFYHKGLLILNVVSESNLQFEIRESFGNLVIGIYFLRDLNIAVNFQQLVLFF